MSGRVSGRVRVRGGSVSVRGEYMYKGVRGECEGGRGVSVRGEYKGVRGEYKGVRGECKGGRGESVMAIPPYTNKLTTKSRMLKPSPSSPFTRSISDTSNSQNPDPGTGERMLALESVASVAKDSCAESGLWTCSGGRKPVLGVAW